MSANANKEIERKWLMDAFPPGEAESASVMEQGYLSFGPPATVRIRSDEWAGETGYTLTIKGGGTLSRAEVEVPLDRGQYEALRPLLAAPAVHKEQRRYALPGGQVLEANLVDEGEPTAFYYAEVEFESEEEAATFVPPAYLAREVTQEPGHTMAAYTRRKAGLG